jgi:hypothetical protein
MCGKKPSIVGRRLRVVGRAAAKLARLLEDLDDQDRVELIEGWGFPKLPRLSERSRSINDAIGYAQNISGGCERASRQVSKVGKTFLIDQPVDSLGEVVKEFAGAKISHEKPVFSFLTEVCAVVDTRFKAGSVRSAVQLTLSRTALVRHSRRN